LTLNFFTINDIQIKNDEIKNKIYTKIQNKNNQDALLLNKFIILGEFEKIDNKNVYEIYVR